MSDFKGFRFGNIHIKDLHLTVISSGDRFNKNLLPDPTDYTVDVPGGNGKYYFGQTHGARVYPVKTAFDNLDEYTIRKIRQIFVTDKPKDLVFDEEPYKVYRAKLSSAPQFNYVCFLDKETNQRVYKGECDFNFIMYHPYAFCFNKYIVTAADFYKCTPPELIIHPSEDTYKLNNNAEPPLPRTVKDHFNIAGNMDTPWKGGYPTIEQVQHGALFYKDPENPDQKGSIVEVKHYWDNVPRWQVAARLLTSPTLDYEHELMYMPQYHQAQYCNLDMGIDVKNFALGNRLLVYNPGDLPIDFKLTLTNLSNAFRGNEKYKFRISRYNVQRMSLEDAVDITGLKTFIPEDEELYKYGNKYFKHKIVGFGSKTLYDDSVTQAIEELTKNITLYEDLGESHPRHCYMVEPIPAEHLSHFIRLFYKQSNLLFNKLVENDGVYTFSTDDFTHIFDHNEGERYAKEYEEKRELCVTDEERNTLYWSTLKEAILDRYWEYNEKIRTNSNYSSYVLFTGSSKATRKKKYEKFVYNYIFSPMEYIKEVSNMNYGEFDFNLSRPPYYYTYDYLDINSNNFDKILYKDCGCPVENEELFNENNRVSNLILDSESRLLYNEIEDLNWEAGNEELKKNYYQIKNSKIVFNDNIEQGHWFQLPPGWSLIDISPIVDETNWGGKRWEDAKAFYWGSRTENKDDRETERINFDKVFELVAKFYLINYHPEKIPSDYTFNKEDNSIKYADGPKTGQEISIDDLQTLIKFRFWNGDTSPYTPPSNYIDKKLSIERLQKSLKRSLLTLEDERYELEFLKILNDYFSYVNVDINQWWWNASNYIWANFPPVYWTYIDLLSRGQIDYIPQYY